MEINLLFTHGSWSSFSSHPSFLWKRKVLETRESLARNIQRLPHKSKSIWMNLQPLISRKAFLLSVPFPRPFPHGLIRFHQPHEILFCKTQVLGYSSWSQRFVKNCSRILNQMWLKSDPCDPISDQKKPNVRDIHLDLFSGTSLLCKIKQDSLYRDLCHWGNGSAYESDFCVVYLGYLDFSYWDVWRVWPESVLVKDSRLNGVAWDKIFWDLENWKSGFRISLPRVIYSMEIDQRCCISKRPKLWHKHRSSLSELPRNVKPYKTYKQTFIRFEISYQTMTMSSRALSVLCLPKAGKVYEEVWMVG